MSLLSDGANTDGFFGDLMVALIATLTKEEVDQFGQECSKLNKT